MHRIIYFLLIFCQMIFISEINASDVQILEIKIQDHKFIPEISHAKVGTKIKLVIHNLDETTEEFESHDLKREKIIPAGGKVTIMLPPLEEGEYKFFGDFDPSSPQGVIKVSL